MFASFFNMFDPAKIFLTTVFNLLNYNKSTYDLDELLKQLSAKNECEVLNCTLDMSAINRQIYMENFFIQNILIKKTNIIFKKMNFANEKAKLFFEDIIIDIFHKKKLEEKTEEMQIIREKENEEKEEKKSGGGSGGFLNNVINVVVHNLVISLKNIKIKIYDKENKNVDYILLIKNINFKEAKDVKPLEAKDKGKFLFVHNKAVYIEGILFKEKYEENDDLFFEEKNENIIKNVNCLLFVKNEIEFDIFHDNEKSILTIGNFTTKFIMENIFNIRQIKTLYNYFIAKEKKDEEKEKIVKKIILVDNNINRVKNNDDGIDFMGFKIKKINFEMKIDLLYLILFDEKKDEKINEKKWISLEENNDEIITKNKIIEHFNIYQNNYYIFYLNNLIKKNKIFIIDNLSLDLIIPENTKKEKENNIINNEINNNIINYIQITKLNLSPERNEFTYDNIYFEINEYFISLINLFLDNSDKTKYVYIYKNNKNKEPEEKKEENNIISSAEKKEINNEKKILIEEENNKLIINGKNLNIKLSLNKNIKDTIESLSLNDIFKASEKNNYINFELNNLNFYNDNIHYDKAELIYNDIELKKS